MRAATWCEACEKHLFASRPQAFRVAKRMARYGDVDMDVYHCHRGSKGFHVSSHPQRIAPKQLRRREEANMPVPRNVLTDFPPDWPRPNS